MNNCFATEARTLEESAAQYTAARESKPELAEVDVKTGEEEESNVFQVYNIITRLS